MRFLMLYSLLLWCPALLADNISDACNGETRLDAPGGSMENLPVLDQSTGNGLEAGGLCYSYVASQMMDAYLQKNGNREAGRISSPFHIAMNHAVARDRLKLEGGEPCLAIEATLQSGGTCDHDKWFIGSHDPHNTHYLYTLEDIWDSFQRLKDLEPYLNEEYLARQRSREYIEETARHDACSLARYDVFSPPDLEIYNTARVALLNLLAKPKYFDSAEDDKEARARDRMLFMRDFANMVCRPTDNRVAPPISPMRGAAVSCKNQNYGSTEREKFKLDLLTGLNSTGLPMAVGFCSFFLQDPTRNPKTNNHRVLNWEADEEGDETPKCNMPALNAAGEVVTKRTTTYHISTIMGRRMKKGRCQVLLRNTWGADACESYRSGGFSDCSGGQVWIDLDELSLNSFAIRAIGP